MTPLKSEYSLPGITAIAYLPCKQLQRHCDLKYLAKMPVQVFANPTPIRFKGTATCEMVSQYDRNGRKETTTLRFNSLSPIPTSLPVAFIVTDANGRSYLMGLNEPPYPVIKITKTTGAPNNEPSVLTHEITFTAQKALIPLG